MLKLETSTYLASFVVQFCSNLSSVWVDFDDTLEVGVDVMYTLKAEFDIVNRRKMTL